MNKEYLKALIKLIVSLADFEDQFSDEAIDNMNEVRAIINKELENT